MEFALLSKKGELVFLILTKYTVESIKESIIYTALSINTYKTKNLSSNINRL